MSIVYLKTIKNINSLSDACSAQHSCKNNGYPDPKDCAKCLCPRPYQGPDGLCDDLSTFNAGKSCFSHSAYHAICLCASTWVELYSVTSGFAT